MTGNNRQTTPNKGLGIGNAMAAKKAADKESKTLMQRLLASAKAAHHATDLQQIFAEAREIGATPEIVKHFAKMASDGDEIGVDQLATTRLRNEAIQEWYSHSWDEREELLRQWAKGGNQLAQGVVEVLDDLFSQNLPLRDGLRLVVDKIERPLRRVQNSFQLKGLLDSLVEEGLTIRIPNPYRVPEHGVVIDQTLYLPRRGVSVAERGWIFVKEAEARIKPVQAALDALKAKATPGLMPNRVSRGEEGNLFLFLGSARAVLLECSSRSGWMTAKIVEAVGVEDLSLPSDAVLWEERDKIEMWPRHIGSRITYSLQQWERKRDKTTAEVEPLVSLATLPISFEEQGLTRLLRGEKGVLAAWHRNFEWSRHQGLFGIAVERTDEGFFLRQVVSPEFEFDEELIGEKLPLAVTAEPLSVRLEKLPQMERGMFLSLKMVEKLLVLRRRAEERTVSGEPVPENGNNGAVANGNGK